MARFKLLISLLVVIGVCSLAATSFAKAKKCAFNGDYSFYFYAPEFYLVGVGYFSVALDPATKCRSGVVLPGGIINCNDTDGAYWESYIEGGSVFLESDGEGTILVETEGSTSTIPPYGGICGTNTNALEADISVVQGGKTVLFNSDGEEYAGSGLIPQAGYYGAITGRAGKCFAGQISGCYDIRFWQQDYPLVGDCTICVNGAGGITGGTCRCNVGSDDGGPEYLSEIETGGYTLGENCGSSTGYMWFTSSSDPICGVRDSMALDFAVADGGEEIIGACDPGEYILDNESLANFGFSDSCAFEGWLQ